MQKQTSNQTETSKHSTRKGNFRKGKMRWQMEEKDNLRNYAMKGIQTYGDDSKCSKCSYLGVSKLS